MIEGGLRPLSKGSDRQTIYIQRFVRSDCVSGMLLNAIQKMAARQPELRRVGAATICSFNVDQKPAFAAISCGSKSDAGLTALL